MDIPFTPHDGGGGYNLWQEDAPMARGKMLRQAVFAVTTTAALGFGAVQAFAAPVAASSGARLCTNEAHLRCAEYCWTRGADNGMCLAGGGCRCIYN